MMNTYGIIGLWLLTVLLAYAIGWIRALRIGRKMYDEMNKAHQTLEEKMRRLIDIYEKL